MNFVLISCVIAALGAIFSSTDTVCTLQVSYTLHSEFLAHLPNTCSTSNCLIHGAETQVINQDETPRLYSLVFGEGVVNDATAVVLFNVIKNLDVSQLKGGVVLKLISDFLYLFATSTIIIGISVRTVFPSISQVEVFAIYSSSAISLYALILSTTICQIGLATAYVLKALYFGR
jgi:hypothetical protein